MFLLCCKGNLTQSALTQLLIRFKLNEVILTPSS
jgi:hypothetical protein